MNAPVRQPPIAILADRPCEWVRELLSRCRAPIDLFSSAWELRRALLAEVQSTRRVLIGAVERPSAMNVAAALARDGRALSVTLVVDEVTGSVRSRAFQAGITEVMDGRGVLAALLGDAGPGVPAPDASAYGGPEDDPEAVGAYPEGPFRSPDEPDPVGFDAPAPAPQAIPPRPSDTGTYPVPSVPVPGPMGFGADPSSVDGSSPMAPKVVLVSGRGGVGKTAVCALMAATAASWGLDVAVVDLDLGFGNLFGYFGLDGPADLTRLGRSEGIAELGLCGKKAGERITVFGPCAKPEYAETVAPKITDMLDALAEAHDLVLVDGGTSWGDGVAQSVQAADRLLVCSDERSGAIGSLARVGSLAVRLGVARTRICQLINRCDPRHRDEGFLARAAEGFQAAQTIHIEDGGVEVAEVMSVGRVVDLVNVANPFSETVAANLGTILSELGILPENERALKAVGARHGARTGASADGRWAA